MTLTMIDLFDGRHDCYFDSAGSALVWSKDGLAQSPDEVWEWAFCEHVVQRRDIGVYPRRDDGLCKWGCVDIDTGDFSEALEVFGGLQEAGVSSWIEASGSWKDLNKRGYHVWVFSSDWVEATNMRALLVEVVRGAGLPEKTEINPKQIVATQKGVGNCVRLPYGKRSVEHPGYSCMVFSPSGEFRDFSVEEFLSEVVPTPVEMIDHLGTTSLHRQSMRRAALDACEALRRHEAHVPPFGAVKASGGQNQRAWKILRGLDRAGDGERNFCAFVIACHLKGTGRSEEAAVSEMAVCVQRSFEGGDEFVDEAVAVVRKVFRSQA